MLLYPVIKCALTGFNTIRNEAKSWIILINPGRKEGEVFYEHLWRNIRITIFGKHAGLL